MRYSLFILLSAMVLLSACKKSAQQKNNGPVMNIVDFPLKQNNEWSYKVSDFYATTDDTLTLKIVDDNNNDSGESWHCIITRNKTIVDSGIFIKKNQEISYHGLSPTQYSYFGNFVLSFPLAANSLWQGFYQVDTVRLVSINSGVKILAINYDNVFFIKRAFFLQGGYSLVQTLQVCPHIGVIQQSLDIFSGGPPQKQEFELIDYKLN